MKPLPLPPHLVDNARQLRRNSTDAEALLWQLLRNRGFGGYKFRRQVAVPPYILDFCCKDRRVAIEVDGGQHALAENAVADERRSTFLAARGIRVLRFWNNEVLRETESVVQRIWDELQLSGPHPSPLPQAAEGDL